MGLSIPTTTLDLRGRDLIIIPPKEWLNLPTEELQEALFGKHVPTALRISKSPYNFSRGFLQAAWEATSLMNDAILFLA
jgi:hypothetical protein